MMQPEQNVPLRIRNEECDRPALLQMNAAALRLKHFTVFCWWNKFSCEEKFSKKVQISASSRVRAKIKDIEYLIVPTECIAQ